MTFRVVNLSPERQTAVRNAAAARANRQRKRRQELRPGNRQPPAGRNQSASRQGNIDQGVRPVEHVALLRLGCGLDAGRMAGPEIDQFAVRSCNYSNPCRQLATLRDQLGSPRGGDMPFGWHGAGSAGRRPAVDAGRHLRARLATVDVAAQRVVAIGDSALAAWFGLIGDIPGRCWEARNRTWMSR